MLVPVEGIGDVEFPDGTSREDILLYTRDKLYPEAGIELPDTGGFFSGLGAAFPAGIDSYQGMFGSYAQGVAEEFGATGIAAGIQPFIDRQKAEEQASNPNPINYDDLPGNFSDAWKNDFKGWRRYFGEATGSTLATTGMGILASLGAAFTAGTAGITGPAVTIAGLAAGSATLLPYYAGEDRERTKKREGRQSLTTGENAAAMGTGAAMAFMDVALAAVGVPKGLRLALLPRLAAEGLLDGSVESVTEVGQSALARWRDGKTLADEDAYKEYKQMAVTAFPLGFGFGVTSSALGRGKPDIPPPDIRESLTLGPDQPLNIPDRRDTREGGGEEPPADDLLQLEYTNRMGEDVEGFTDRDIERRTDEAVQRVLAKTDAQEDTEALFKMARASTIPSRLDVADQTSTPLDILGEAAHEATSGSPSIPVIQELAKEKNILTNRGALFLESFKEFARQKTGSSQIGNLTARQRQALYDEINELPTLNRPSEIPFVKGPSYSVEAYQNAERIAIESGKLRVSDIQSSEVTPKIAKEIQEDLTKNGVLTKKGNQFSLRQPVREADQGKFNMDFMDQVPPAVEGEESTTLHPDEDVALREYRIDAPRQRRRPAVKGKEATPQEALPFTVSAMASGAVTSPEAGTGILAKEPIASFKTQEEADAAAERMRQAPPGLTTRELRDVAQGAPEPVAAPTRRQPGQFYSPLRGQKERVTERLMPRLKSQAIKRGLQKLGLPVKLIQSVEEYTGGQRLSPEEIMAEQAGEGVSTHDQNMRRVIALAFDAVPSELTTDEEIVNYLSQILDHEVIHALIDAGVMTNAQWKRLFEASQRTVMDPATGQTFYQWAESLYSEHANAYAEKTDGGETAYRQYVGEEAIAQMFRHYANDPASVDTAVKGIIDKIIEAIRKMVATFRGQGFQFADEIMGDIESGAAVDQAMAEGRAQTGTQGGETRFSRRTSPSENIDTLRGMQVMSHFGGDKVDSVLNDVQDPMSRSTIVLMSPDDFIAMATKGLHSPGQEEVYAQNMSRGMALDEIPYLGIEDDESGKIGSHEGRHRSWALKAKAHGYSLIPVELRASNLRWGMSPMENRPRVLKSQNWGGPTMIAPDSVAFPAKEGAGIPADLMGGRPQVMNIGLAPQEATLDPIARDIQANFPSATTREKPFDPAFLRNAVPRVFTSVADAARQAGAREVINADALGAYGTWDPELSSGLAASFPYGTQPEQLNAVAAEVFRIAQQERQLEAFVALEAMDDVIDNSDAPTLRPGISLFFRPGFMKPGGKTLDQVLELIKTLQTSKVGGFTAFSSEPRPNKPPFDKFPEAANRSYEGMNFMWTPEYTGEDVGDINASLEEAVNDMLKIAEYVEKNRIASASIKRYNAILSGDPDYDQAIQSLAPSDTGRISEAARAQWRKPIVTSVQDAASRDRRRKAQQQRDELHGGNEEPRLSRRNSGVPLQTRPLQVTGTGAKGRITNWDIAQAFHDRHMAEYGRALDPTNDRKDFILVANKMYAEYMDQQNEADSGNGWYVEDMQRALETTERSYLPEIADPSDRDFFVTLVALMSPRKRPVENWEDATLLARAYFDSRRASNRGGRLPLRKANGAEFGTQTDAIVLLNHMVDDMGQDGALEWLNNPHTGREIAEYRRDSGVFKPGRAIGQYLASETNLTTTYMGMRMFGPKVTEFRQNASGADHDAVTVDMWLARTYNRAIGRLLDVGEKLAGKDPASDVRGVTERDTITRLVHHLRDRIGGIYADTAQASLWFFEQRLWRNHGATVESQNFAQAADAAAIKRGIDPRTGEAVPSADTDAQGTVRPQTQGTSGPASFLTPAWGTHFSLRAPAVSRTPALDAQVMASPIVQRALQDPNFQTWLNARGAPSMVDENGLPVVTYHATDGSPRVSTVMETGATTEVDYDIIRGNQHWTKASFVTPSRDFANEFIGYNPETLNRDPRLLAMEGSMPDLEVGGRHRIIPVFTNVNRPFDLEAKPHLDELYDWLSDWEKTPDFKELHKRVQNDYASGSTLKEITRDPVVALGVPFTKEMREDLERGDWNEVEDLRVIHALRNIGFDGFHTFEMDGKHLGVFDPASLKSIFNDGGWSLTDPDIRHSKRTKISDDPFAIPANLDRTGGKEPTMLPAVPKADAPEDPNISLPGRRIFRGVETPPENISLPGRRVFKGVYAPDDPNAPKTHVPDEIAYDPRFGRADPALRRYAITVHTREHSSGQFSKPITRYLYAESESHAYELAFRSPYIQDNTLEIKSVTLADRPGRYSMRNPPGYRAPHFTARAGITANETVWAYNKIGQYLQKLHYRSDYKFKVPHTDWEFSVIDVRRKIQDKNIMLKMYEEGNERRGGILNDDMRTYATAELEQGVSEESVRLGEKEYYNLFYDHVKKSWQGEARLDALDRINDYAYATHVEERNARLLSEMNPTARAALIEQATNDPRHWPAGRSDAWAQDILQKEAATKDFTKITDAVALLRRIVNNTNDVSLEAKLIDQSMIDAGMETYFPLRGGMTQEIDPITGEPIEDSYVKEEAKAYAKSPAGNIRGRESKTATGRHTEATDIITHVILSNMSARLRAQRNNTLTTFGNSVKLESELNAKDKQGAVAWRLGTYPMRKTKVNGVIKMVPDQMAHTNPNYVMYKEHDENGNVRQVIIETSDWRLARALNGGINPEKTNELTKLMGNMNRWLAMVNTSLNPEFLLSNLPRDVQTALGLATKYDMENFTKNVLKGKGGIWSAMHGIESVVRKDPVTGEEKRKFVPGKMSPEAEHLATRYREMRELGAVTDFMGIQGMEQINKKMFDTMRDVGDATKLQNAWKMAKSVGEIIQDYNLVVENAVRVVLFDQLVSKNIMTPKMAAHAAKNLTVNFTKGGELKTILNSWFLFANVSIQGTANIVSGIAKSKQVRRVVGGWIALGFVLDQMNSLLSGDEDDDGRSDYDEVDLWNKEHNFILMMPEGLGFKITNKNGSNPSGHYLKMPLAWLFNGFFNMGRVFSSQMRGGDTLANNTNSLVFGMIDALNPLGGTGSLLNFAFPTIADPFIDLGTNKDFTRKSIRPERLNYDGPISQLYWHNTSPVFKGMAEFMNALGGGNQFKKGVGWLDNSPEQYEYVFDYLLGGAGAFILRTATPWGDKSMLQQVQNAFSDTEQVDTNQISLLRKFVGSVGNIQSTRQFYENAEKIRLPQYELDNFQKAGNWEEVRRIQKEYAPELRISKFMKNINSELTKQRQQLKQIRANPGINDELKKRMEKQIQARMDFLINQANRMYNQTVRDGS